jgi:asparagine synthase (glutamine-hydrolysing)
VAETMAEVGRTARADVQLAEFCGISLHNPFTDSRVIDTYLSVPSTQRPGPADYKPILRRALADVLPPALKARATKGDFNTDHHRGMRAARTYLHKLADGHLAAHGLLHPVRLRQMLTRAAAGVPVASAMVEPVVTAEVWLRALHAAPPIPWTTQGGGT